MLRSRFASRILPVDASVAEKWGEIAAEAGRAGRAVHVIDGLLAATGVVFGLVVVTRNIADFEMTTAPVLNPWS